MEGEVEERELGEERADGRHCGVCMREQVVLVLFVSGLCPSLRSYAILCSRI